MDTIAQLNTAERIELFQEASALKGNLSAPTIEKDFWVCWILRRLFSMTESSPRLLFKGGTSLSKVFKIISRFSEDIDLSFNRDDLGFVGERDTKREMSGKNRKRLLEEIEASCVSYIADKLVPALTQDFAGVIGDPEEAEHSWSLKIDDQNPLTVFFNYPAVIPLTGTGVPDYIRPIIRLELGARSDPWPSKEYKIQSYASEVFPDLFDNPIFSVNTLEAERTFWEKATLLHAEYHSPEGRESGDRLSRHYYDLACLAQSPIKDRAIGDIDLLKAVVEHKQLFYRSRWAHYETACPGTFRLVPPRDRLPILRNDYRKMEEMFFDAPPTFELIMESLKELETDINS